MNEICKLKLILIADEGRLSSVARKQHIMLLSG